ncbi:MAG: adenylate kinase, partial [Pseudonocardiaceae bacterium]
AELIEQWERGATRIVLLGRQGAGKGTQAELLAQHYGVPRVSTGDMFRAGVNQTTEWGLDVHRSMDSGELVADDLVVAMVRQRISEPDAANRGFVLEGFPRTTAQAEALDTILRPHRLNLVIELVVPVELVLVRLAARRVCVSCGTNYSVERPPVTDWTCDSCGGPVVERQDDRSAVISRRLALYEEQTAPLVSWYRQSGRLCTADGTGDLDVVTARLLAAVEQHRLAMAQPPGTPLKR